MTFINVENVNKLFRGKNKNSDEYALDYVNFSIKKGEFFCILGPSGCGKSTLLNMMAGFELPTNGKIVIDNNEMKEPSPKYISVFQEYGLFPWRSVSTNIGFGLEFSDKKETTKNKTLEEYTKLVGLDAFKHKSPVELSGGMKQRVALARALAVHPEVLFMDEPFGALDEITRITLQKELLRIWEEKQITIIFVTHNIESAIALGDRIAVMTPHPGKIKKIINLQIDRPRDIASQEFENIKKDILLEFGIS
ncbi:MAG TPA: ABC transporter ATP-binding protein [Patescibacteria group bacterium]|nr:ABC transporter ATP-binding protein [Patescibacteria group bacterium]